MNGSATTAPLEKKKKLHNLKKITNTPLFKKSSSAEEEIGEVNKKNNKTILSHLNKAEARDLRPRCSVGEDC